MGKALTLYHGSTLIIEHPQFGKGNPFDDYGRGFYCTETLEVAKEWACSMSRMALSIGIPSGLTACPF